jgi:galactose mutarotase-like enzyme
VVHRFVWAPAVTYRIETRERDGFAIRELSSPDGLVAGYAPQVGMICCSLCWRGEELLGQRKGLRVYAERGSTMGIPLLHPWANRLGRRGYAFGDVEIEMPEGSPLLHTDPNGLPIHGLLAGCPDWVVEDARAEQEQARLVARLDAAALPELMALFPFPHELRIEATLRRATLAVATTLRATGDAPVPVAFGYHPYFRLPGVPRESWEVTLPVRRRAELDGRCLPTGASKALRIEPGPLAGRTYDDLFPELEPEPVFALAGGGRRIEVGFGEGYPVAVVYAPGNDDVVCFEPMTAPTDPFARPAGLRRVAPGASFTARFSIRVS